MQNSSSPKTVLLSEYKAPEYFIDTVELYFDLNEDQTQVRNKMKIRKNSSGNNPLLLNGEDLKLASLNVNGSPYSDYAVEGAILSVRGLPENFELEIVTFIEPQKNLSLEGLYKTGSVFCTQNEAEGFRKITYFLDRPDVMAVYTTSIEADKSKYPFLLSNGNLVEKKDLPNNRHLCVWNDPFKKPCYLFALVAGDLGLVKSSYKSKKGKIVSLEFFVNKGNEKKCDHAIESLKKAMRWDEETFGLEYDLDLYMVVAVDDFNAGAMENKGLNIFNSRLVLANPQTATDGDYMAIESVIGHEYFHNWTGNRVTCRDWFQLSLKEGLTVFRDQEFSSDLNSRAVQRIDDVMALRARQFPEDAGPMAHPIRPTSYIEINNFYTPTVYEKGAEVIRMIHTYIGNESFKKGITKYFELYDGSAVRTEDFVHAMELASGKDLSSQFSHWYHQAGTPEVKVTSEYNASNKTYELTLSQKCPASPGQSEKLPFAIPVAVGLINSRGGALPFKTSGKNFIAGEDGTVILDLTESVQTFKFVEVSEKPIPSLLRNFSAPIKLSYDFSREELVTLMKHDPNAFSRWEAGQKCALDAVFKLVSQLKLGGKEVLVDESLIDAFLTYADSASPDAAFAARMLNLPDETYIAQFYETVDIDAIHKAINTLKLSIAKKGKHLFEKVYSELQMDDPTRINNLAYGRRALKNKALEFLALLKSEESLQLAFSQQMNAKNMTDEINALKAISCIDKPERIRAMETFYNKWKGDNLVILKWMAVKAESDLPGALRELEELLSDSVFDIRNPNKCYSLFRTFGAKNVAQFHRIDGKGYEFLAENIMKIDEKNGQVAARLAGLFEQWRKFDPVRQSLMKTQIERINQRPGVSPNVFEITSKALLN